MLSSILALSLISAPPPDKVAHFALSYAMTHSCQVLTKKLFNASKLKSTIICAGAVLVAGAAKEIADPYMGGQRDSKDLIADMAGIGLAVTIISVDW